MIHAGFLFFFQTKQPEELEQLLAAVTDIMETAASTSDLSTAREGLQHRMEQLAESLAVSDPADSCSGAGAIETLMLPFPKCHICSWENDNFGNYCPTYIYFLYSCGI